MKEMSVIAASIMFNRIQQRIQPLQKRDHFDFEYLGTKENSRFSVEPMERVEGLRRIRSVFPDLLGVPYVPTVFRASNPISQVRTNWKSLYRVLLFLFLNSSSDKIIPLFRIM